MTIGFIFPLIWLNQLIQTFMMIFELLPEFIHSGFNPGEGGKGIFFNTELKCDILLAEQ
jgi:hypothetical protein